MPPKAGEPEELETVGLLSKCDSELEGLEILAKEPNDWRPGPAGSKIKTVPAHKIDKILGELKAKVRL